MLSWSEFSDIERKMTRYTRAIRALKELLYWWMALGEVEKANMENISRLIENGEAIINYERVAWVSTSKKKDTENGIGDDTNESDAFDNDGNSQSHSKRKVTPI